MSYTMHVSAYRDWQAMTPKMRALKTETKQYHFDGGETVRVIKLSASVFKAILVAGDKVDLDAAGYGGTVLEAIADLNQALIKAAEDER